MGKFCAISQSDWVEVHSIWKSNANIFPRETMNSESMNDDNVLSDYLRIKDDKLIKKIN